MAIEVIVLGVLSYNIASHVRSTPSSKWISQKFPLHNYLFTSGPVTQGLYTLMEKAYHFAKNQYVQATKKKAPAPTAPLAPSTPANNNQPATAPSVTPSTNPQARPQPWKGPINDSPGMSLLLIKVSHWILI